MHELFELLGACVDHEESLGSSKQKALRLLKKSKLNVNSARAAPHNLKCAPYNMQNDKQRFTEI
jgi:hypothetical protein